MVSRSTPTRSIFFWHYCLLSIFFVEAKELLLPPCEEIPISLCNEGRIKSACPKICGKLFEEEEEATEPPRVTKSDKATTAVFSHTTFIKKSTPPDELQEKAIENNTTSVNETDRKSFLAPKPSQKSPKTTLAPETEEEINEFFEPKTKSNFLATTPIPITTTPKSINKTKTCDKIHPCVELAEANEQFLNRCRNSNPPMAPNCFGICRYDISLPDLKNAFVRGLCPVGQTRLYMKAASASNDNSYCCRVTGILEIKRGLCYAFCNPSGPIWPTRKETIKYLPCLQAMEPTMRCHWAGLS